MVSAFILPSSGLLFAEENPFVKPSVKDILEDVLCYRPLGFIEITVNSLFFVISLPITIPLGDAKYAEEWLIRDPFNFYFNRRLGEPLGK